MSLPNRDERTATDWAKAAENAARAGAGALRRAQRMDGAERAEELRRARFFLAEALADAGAAASVTKRENSVEIIETVDGRWIVLARGFQWGPDPSNVDRSGANRATFPTRKAALSAWISEVPTCEKT